MAVPRILVGFALGVVAVLIVVSLRALASPQTPLEPGEIVVLTGADDSVGGQRQRLIDQWNDDHPDNPARLESLSSEADRQHSEMVARAQSGASGVDVYNLDVTWVTEFAAAGFIQPLDGSVNTAGFLAKPLETCGYDGKLWALPFNTDAGLLYYRTDLVPGGAPPAQIPPTEADMRRLATGRQMKAGYAGQLGDYEGLTVNALELIWAAQGDVVDPDGRVVIDSPEARAGLERLAGAMVASGGLPPAVLPESRTYTERDSTEAFRSGAVALMRNWPVAYGQLMDDQERAGAGGFDIAKNFAVTQLPGPSVLGGQNLAIARDTTKPRAARALIEFLTSDSSQRRLFRDGGLPATRHTTYADASVREARPYADILLAAVEDARPRPRTPHYALFTAVFQEVVREALTPSARGRLPADAVSRLTDALNGRLR
ncbi:ABC transporter substrate-binding protein [Micromonospora sp. CPCC 206061]|uniref:ABC transporter substrate-binding protein n=1 Tax=Micromonospora sp. CPCC 206061 TaxID=3122410 RepID=UPI002FEEF216